MSIGANRYILVHTHYLKCISKNDSFTKGFESSLTAKHFHKFSRKQVTELKTGSTLIVSGAFVQLR